MRRPPWDVLVRVLGCLQKDNPHSIHSQTHRRVVFILTRGRRDSKDNNEIWLYILFSQTSSKLTPSPSSWMPWGSHKSKHPSHLSQPACSLASALLSTIPLCFRRSICKRSWSFGLSLVQLWSSSCQLSWKQSVHSKWSIDVLELILILPLFVLFTL